jgi:hypothetical protein
MSNRNLAGVMVAVAICLTAVGCGDKEAAPTNAQIRKAEEVVRCGLPATPIWEKATFRGVATGGGDVCVNRILAKQSTELLGSTRASSNVIVAIPGFTTSRPLALIHR